MFLYEKHSARIGDKGRKPVAVFHLKMSVGSRAGGQSAVAKADYIEREGRYEQDREELEHRESGNMPEWAEKDPRSYWEAADEYERANGRLYREVQFALPKELNEGQRRELASGFAKRLTEGEWLPYTLAVHRGDGENPHAHLMFSERANDGIERSREQWFRRTNRREPEKGGARKSRVAVSQTWLEQTREAWAREANEALERAGYGERIDHRSLASLRDEAERSGDLERADRVEKDNEALAEERDGLIERIKERIAGIYQELQALPEKIREAGERVKQWDYKRELFSAPSFAELARKYSHVYHDVASGAGARAMTDSPTRVAEQRWHYGVPGAAVALMAVAATLLPALAVAQDVYLRAGIDLSRPANTHFTDADCASLVPAALYGCGLGDDGAPLRSVGDVGPVAGLELGLGYAVVPAVRLEALLTYRPRFTFDGHANFLAPDREQSVSVDLSSLSGILAVYVDLPGVGVRPLGPLSPFVGGGLGATRVASGETRMTFPKTRTLVPGTRRTALTWRLTAGLGMSWGERATLDLAWRYTDAGVIETGAGPGRVEWLDGSREPVGLDLAPTQAPLRSHGLHLSLRYEL